MPRANAMVPPDAIRIEDEVWQEAFTRREPASRDRGRRLDDRAGRSEERPRRLEAIEGGRADRTREQARVATARPEPVSVAFAAAPAVPEATLAAVSTTPVPAAARTDDPPARRTIKIQGRGAERNLPVPDPARRRPSRRPYERAGFRPDRLAMWAVVLGFLLLMIAVLSAHG